MRLITRLLAASLAAVAPPSAAQIIPVIALMPGEAVTVRVGAEGRAAPPERHRAEWNAFDVYAAKHLTGITPPDAPVPTGTPFSSAIGDPKPAPIPPGQLQARFLSITGRHSLLVIENGLQGAVRYRAKMTVDGKTIPTDVCIVMANTPSYEHWPHPIERIELTDFRYVAVRPGETPTCE